MITPETTIVDDGKFELGDQVRKNAKDAVFGPLELPRALTVSSDIFFYELGEQLNAKGPVLQEWAKRLGVGRKTGIDIPGEFAGPDPGQRLAQQGLRRVPQVHEEGEGHAGHDRGALQVRRHRAAVDRRATTSASRSGRATCRPRRCSSPRRTRRSSTTARSFARTSGSRSRTAAAGWSRRSARRSAGACTSSPATATRSWPACTAPRPPRRHVGRRVRRLPAYRDMLYGKTGTAERQPNPDQSWYACYVADATRADRGRHDDRARWIRRGDCGTRGAPDPQRVVRCRRTTSSNPGPTSRIELPPDPASFRAAAPAHAPRVAPADGPAAPARHARARGLLADRAQRRDAERHRRASRTTT